MLISTEPKRKGDEMGIINAVLEYFRSRQSPKIRFLHVVILLLVISQIIVSNFMDFTAGGEISEKTVEYYGTWIHIITGLTLLPIALVFVAIEIRERGFRYFFPYLSGEFEQLKSDISRLKKFDIPEPEAGGLAAIVMGLGLGALFLALLSGLGWFLSWNYNLQWAHDIKELHEALVGLVEAYVIGHGSMGLLHIFYVTRRGQNH